MDRKVVGSWPQGMNPSSLSARRAWIENDVSLNYKEVLYVALRKESVDRKNLFANPGSTTLTSLSARRAWIEKLSQQRTEQSRGSRSPQGERG